MVIDSDGRMARGGVVGRAGTERGATPAPAPGRSRRRFVGSGAAGGAALVTGCGPLGDDDDPAPTGAAGTPAAVATATGFIPGYEDPTRWVGRVLRVAAWGGEVQDALRATIWDPFGRATG